MPAGSREQSPSASGSGRSYGELGLLVAESQANFAWIELGEAEEARLLTGLAERRIAVRPGSALGDPGHIRVTFGTPAEDDRFLAALGELLD